MERQGALYKWEDVGGKGEERDKFASSLLSYGSLFQGLKQDTKITLQMRKERPSSTTS